MTAQLLLLRAMPAQGSVAHAMRLYCAAALRCCTSTEGWSVDFSHATKQIVCQSSGSEFGCQLYLAFVGVLCAMFVSWGIVVAFVCVHDRD